MRRSIRNWLCKHSRHNWKRISGFRHWHVECINPDCGKREIWRNHNRAFGYQPIQQNWERKGLLEP